MSVQIISYNKTIQNAIDAKNKGVNLQEIVEISFIPKTSITIHYYTFDPNNVKKDNCVEVHRGARNNIKISLNDIIKGGLNNLLGYVDFIEDVIQKKKEDVVEEQKAEELKESKKVDSQISENVSEKPNNISNTNKKRNTKPKNKNGNQESSKK